MVFPRQTESVTLGVDFAAIAKVDEYIKTLPPSEGVVSGCFTPGIYTRQIFMKQGDVHRSKIHKTEHQYIISQGSAFVRENVNGVQGPWILYNAPYRGVTKPGTWRELFIITDMLWTTIHRTDRNNVIEVERDIILSEESK